MNTSHYCPRFAAGDVLGIEKILRNMAHMSNIFSHHVGTEDWLEVGCHYMVPILGQQINDMLVERSI